MVSSFTDCALSGQYRIPLSQIQLSREDILRLFSQNSEDGIAIIENVIPEVYSQAEKLCQPCGEYVICTDEVAIDTRRGSVALVNNELGSIVFYPGSIITSQLRNATSLAVFVCTIGSGMEQWSKEILSKGDPLLSYVADRVASLIAERTADIVYRHIVDEAKQIGYSATQRFSPGYCGWQVLEQRTLFSFFPHNFCGIHLTESFLMVPIKSVSGIVGIGKNVVWEEYFCTVCHRKDCLHRILQNERKG